MVCNSCLKESVCEVQLANVMQQQDLHICNAIAMKTHEACCTGKQALMPTRNRSTFVGILQNKTHKRTTMKHQQWLHGSTQGLWVQCAATKQTDEINSIVTNCASP